MLVDPLAAVNPVAAAVESEEVFGGVLDRKSGVEPPDRFKRERILDPNFRSMLLRMGRDEEDRRFPRRQRVVEDEMVP